MARQIQRYQSLEQQRPPRPCGAQEDEQAGGGAPIGHHVQHRAELCRLLEIAGRDTVQCVQQAGYAVEERAGTGVQWHVVEGGDGEDDAGVAWIEIISIRVLFGVMVLLQKDRGGELMREGR